MGDDMFKYIFMRYEKKYKINESQYQTILSQIKPYTVPDKYGFTKVNTLYFDTPQKIIIRNSIEKPVYKEKLRLRCYNQCKADDYTFTEIKKKYKGIVYKRRICSDYKSAYNYLLDIKDEIPPSQIKSEIDYFKSYYAGIQPSMCIFYDRNAFYDKNDPNVRITFDNNLLYRDYDLDLTKGIYGKKIITEECYIMEIKTLGAIPLWLCKILDNNRIYPISFSKYGNVYLQTLFYKENKTYGLLV